MRRSCFRILRRLVGDSFRRLLAVLRVNINLVLFGRCSRPYSASAIGRVRKVSAWHWQCDFDDLASTVPEVQNPHGRGDSAP